MDLINATKMIAGYTMGMEPIGKVLLVVAVRGTFVIPQDGNGPKLMMEQVPLVEADVYTGEPGYLVALCGVDFAINKEQADFILFYRIVSIRLV